MSYDRGDTARAKTSITDIDNNPADPIELVFRILKPSGIEISHTYAPESGAIVRTAKGDYYIDVPLDEVGDWPYRWEGSGVVGGAEEGIFTVHRSAFEFAAGGILSLAEYKRRRQLTKTSPERDEAIEAAIASAEDAVLQYTDRDFTTAQAEETREFPWEVHTMILETDDFVGKPSQITLEAPGIGSIVATFPTYAYWLGPREGPTYYFIDFTPSKNFSIISVGKMGFTRNLDTYYTRGGSFDYATVKVTAKFGWPGSAPASVKQAVTWLVDEFIAHSDSSEPIESESIANLAYTYQRESLRERPPTLPPRVQQLLDPYRRIAL